MSTKPNLANTTNPESEANPTESADTTRSATAATPTTSKELILDAAQNLLAHHGYAGLSMRELAAESGLAKATIYHHFQDKDEIFRSVLERDMAMVHGQLVAAATEATGAVNQISAVIRVYVGLMRQRRTVIMSVLRELGSEATNLCAFIEERRHRYFAPITTILEAGIAEGVFRPLHVEQTAISLIGMINAFVIFAPDENSSDEDCSQSTTTAADEQFIGHITQLLLFGIHQRD